ncbi:MAG: hypothetical protein SNJ78_08175 [Spirochaetales bacterium]
MSNCWPNFSQYNAALYRPEQGLIPAELKEAKVARNGYGIPDPLSGGVAYIYKLTLPGGQPIALRLFMREDPVRDTRLPWVLNRLAEVRKRNSLLNFGLLHSKWIEQCVKTSVRVVPAVVMEWSLGLTVSEWLRHHRGNKQAILALQDQFFQLLNQMEKEGIAHGDLQVGNILVEKNSRPVLVDYDGIAFFEETEKSPNQGGHPNFQHPKRFGQSLSNTILDRFSALSIDLGLEAWAYCSTEPWFENLVLDGDTLYFSRSDYEDPESSEAFTRLKGVPQLKEKVLLFESICKGSVLEVPTLADFRKAVATAIMGVIKASLLESEAEIGATLGQEGSIAALEGAEGLAAVETQKTQEEVEIGEAAEEVSGIPTPKKTRPDRPTPQKRKKAYPPYVSTFPLFSALDVDALLDRVGEMVEVIGKVTEIFEGETKYGDPYIFVNFMDWREPKIFHLVAWSEDLDSLEDPPDISWKGKWIHITGLVDEPYYKKLWQEGGKDQIRLSVRIRNNRQYRFLSETEARRRLKASISKEYPVNVSVKPSSPRGSTLSRDQIWKSLASRTPNTLPSTGDTRQENSPFPLQTLAREPMYLGSPNSSLPARTFPSPNQEILKQLGTVESKITTPLSSPSDSTPTSFHSSFFSSNTEPPQQPSQSESSLGWLFWVVLGVIAFLYLLSQ